MINLIEWPKVTEKTTNLILNVVRNAAELYGDDQPQNT